MRQRTPGSETPKNKNKKGKKRITVPKNTEYLELEICSILSGI
jgi:hypothetical protein